MRLLIVEDEMELSNALCAILKHNNYAVDAVYDGKEALAYLESDIYDGVILDIMMPKVDGITVLKTIRAKGSKIPVIMLTAKSEIDDKILGLDSGADDYLAKPFDMKELLARIRAMTRRLNDVVDNTISFADIVLDRGTYELSSHGSSLKLNGKEFQMMELMMINPKMFFSADYFMSKIWSFDSDAEINVVWVYISNLRKKLSSLDSNVEIKVKRNLGYYLEEKS